MEELIKLLVEELEYKTYKIMGDHIYMYVRSAENQAICPHCDYEIR